MAKGELNVITRRTLDALLRVERWAKNFRVIGAEFNNTPDGATLVVGGAGGRPPSVTRTAAAGSPHINAIVTGASRDGSNWRWTYTVKRATKATASWGGWTALTGADSLTAFNRAEAINTSSGMLGIGVTVGKIPAGFELQPIPTNTPIVIDAVSVAGGAIEWWFYAANGIDGECAT